jgi:hypothetical protein
VNARNPVRKGTQRWAPDYGKTGLGEIEEEVSELSMSNGYSSDSEPMQEERKPCSILRQQTLSPKPKTSNTFKYKVTPVSGSGMTLPDPDRKSQEPGSIGKEEFPKISISNISKESPSKSS